MQKKRFILRLPYFLATHGSSLPIRLMFAACYVLLILGYLLPLTGTLLASAACLVFWQFFNIKTKKDPRYEIYCSFLLQRLVFCNIFVTALFVYCGLDYEFNYGLWSLCIFTLAFLNASDVYFTLKGFIGVAFIHGNKNKN